MNIVSKQQPVGLKVRGFDSKGGDTNIDKEALFSCALSGKANKVTNLIHEIRCSAVAAEVCDIIAKAGFAICRDHS
ncbi:MAG: hypothetical protein ACXV7F_14140 [Methylomonas sp.]